MVCSPSNGECCRLVCQLAVTVDNALVNLERSQWNIAHPHQACHTQRSYNIHP